MAEGVQSAFCATNCPRRRQVTEQLVHIGERSQRHDVGDFQ
jgi:hypothetical protein